MIASTVTDDLHDFLVLVLDPSYQPIQKVPIPYADFPMYPTIPRIPGPASAVFRPFVALPIDPGIVAPVQAEWSPQTENIPEQMNPTGTLFPDLAACDMVVFESTSGISRLWGVRRDAFASADGPLRLGKAEEGAGSAFGGHWRYFE
jgi:hypothetical protein